MQLTCPNCGARYRIDASAWPTEPGPDEEPVFRPRRARCKVCRSVWAAIPEEEVLELDDPLPPDEEHPRLADAAWPSVGGWPDPKPLAPPAQPQPDFTPPLDRPPPVFTPAGFTPSASSSPSAASRGASSPTASTPASPSEAPSPPGFTPPKDPTSPLFAPPARPSIHFEAPPVPIPTPEPPRVRARLPGPGWMVPDPAVADAGREAVAAEEPQADPVGPDEEAWDSEEDEAEPGTRRWRWLLGAGALAAVVWAALVMTGRVAPQDYGLPRYNPSAIGLPEIDVPDVRLPRAAPPPLGVEAEAVRRSLPGGRQVWEIAGTISNPTARAQPVPPVELLLLDARGGVVARWTVRPEAATVAPGKAVRFETSAIDPPPRAVRLRMQLKPSELGRL
jgi:predicted Zn finger-like uncharacterized protein